MKVEAISINQVFLNNRVLKIPFFQRGYVWNEANWQRFFDDIANVASLPEGETPQKYFLGSIILKDAGFKNGCQQFDVIDGQQRLTTIVMFMKALYLALGRDDMFRNGFMQMSLTGDSKPILVANYNDLRVYNEIVSLETLKTEPIASNNRLALAFSYFAKRILAAAYPEDGSTPISLAALLNSVINYVRLVSIEVQDGENAQKIFETINCTGIKLTTGELLKNFLFDEGDMNSYERTWKPVFEMSNQKYWEGDMVNGRIADSHIENFFYRYMLIKMLDPAIKSSLTQNEIKSFRQKEGLFDKFRQLIDKFNISKEAAVDEIVSYAKLYADTFKAGMLDETIIRYNGVERLAYLMYTQDFWTPVPYILYILKNVESKRERDNIFSYMETYLMRRLICKSKNNSYSDMFSENLIGQGVNTFEAFKAYVNDAVNRGTLLMPSDEDVIDAVKQNDLKRDAQVILYMLESRLNDSFSTSSHDNSFNLFVKEQIMPEKADANWPLGAGVTEEQRGEIAKTLGNFIILREKLQPKAKKAAWLDKKADMKPKCEELDLFKCVQNGLRTWDEKIVEERNAWLADKILDTWSK